MAVGGLTASPFDRPGIGLAAPLAFVFILGASWLLPATPLTALLVALLLAYMAMSPAIASGAAFRVAFPFAAMMVWGVLLSSGNEGYLIGKDIWYASKLCLGLMLGFIAGIRAVDGRSVSKALIAMASVMALSTIALWIVTGSRVGELDGEDASRLPLVATAAIIPLMDMARQRRGLERGWGIGLMLLLAGAVAVSNSRITIIAAGTMLLAWAGLFSRTRRALIGGFVVVAGLALLWQWLPEYTGGELTVAIKLRRSLDEILFTDNFDSTQMILNWRGFEAYNAQLMFDQSSLLRKLFGNGLGAVVDLGEEVAISNEASYRFLPILHNGFYYIIIKYGLAGVLVYVGAVFRFGLLGNMQAGNMTTEDRMLRGAIVTALMTTAVITGMYNKTEMNGLTLLIGWLIGFAQRHLHDRLEGEVAID